MSEFYHDPDREWSLLPENVDMELCASAWTNGVFHFFQTPQGWLMKMDRGNPHYDTYVATRLSYREPLWDYGPIAEDEWELEIVPHLGAPALLPDPVFDADDIELAQIIMDEIEEERHG